MHRIRERSISEPTDELQNILNDAIGCMQLRGMQPVALSGKAFVYLISCAFIVTVSML